MAESKEERILAAADVLFSRHGLRKTSVDEIAKEAQVGKGTIYSYYDSKESVFLAVQRKHVSFALQKFRSAIRSEASPANQLKKYLQVRFTLMNDYARSRPFNVEIFAETHSQPECKIVSEEFEREEASIIRGILEAGAEAGEFHGNDISATLWVIQQAIFGLTMTIFLRGDLRILDRVSELHRVLLSGISIRNN